MFYIVVSSSEHWLIPIFWSFTSEALNMLVPVLLLCDLPVKCRSDGVLLYLLLSCSCHRQPIEFRLLWCVVLFFWKLPKPRKLQGLLVMLHWWSSPPTGVCFCPLSSFQQKLRAPWTGEMRWALWGHLCYDLTLTFKIFQRCVCLA